MNTQTAIEVLNPDAERDTPVFLSGYKNSNQAVLDRLDNLEKAIAEQAETIVDVLASRGLIRPANAIKLKTRRLQAAHCQLTLTTYKTHILPLVEFERFPTRGDLDKAVTVYQAEQNLKTRRRGI